MAYDRYGPLTPAEEQALEERRNLLADLRHCESTLHTLNNQIRDMEDRIPDLMERRDRVRAEIICVRDREKRTRRADPHMNEALDELRNYDRMITEEQAVLRETRTTCNYLAQRRRELNTRLGL
jgi:chromosome segregation ATPase